MGCLGGQGNWWQGIQSCRPWWAWHIPEETGLQSKGKDGNKKTTACHDEGPVWDSGGGKEGGEVAQAKNHHPGEQARLRQTRLLAIDLFLQQCMYNQCLAFHSIKVEYQIE